MQPERGDVVRSSDPFKLGEDSQRPWLIVNNESHPFNDEQFLAVAVSTKEYRDSLVMSSDNWDVGVFHSVRSFLRGQSTHHGLRT
ncbi:hypothetical protein [Halobacterium litoreum]|uniref:PemK-like, MazF-like toxin of type II toxin-antitoxin system n=1 Tax=Halobacterium litoreum TaxID=2039234 RepID=A0ABD5NCJ2_9EURY|nr:hypothetical protein [Halobacterium litoreum]UHH14121.1 hypothetical protein LT972_03750 [Halobacterium litoreum]